MNIIQNPTFLLILFFTLFGGEIVLFSLFFTTFKSVSKVFKKTKSKDIMKVLSENLEHMEDIDKYLNHIDKEMEKDRYLLNLTLHKVGIVRFNPFKDMGGKQSFCVALLNSENSGVVITSFYGKEGAKTYAKQVIQGASEQNLSPEELKAISEAQKSLKK